MITFKFTTGETNPLIFRVAPDEELFEGLEVPLRIQIPREAIVGFGKDEVQSRITAAMEEMIQELNSELLPES